MQKTLFKSRRSLIDGQLRPATLVVEQGLIRSIEAIDYELPSAASRDYGDWVLMAGLVDTHVHINEPGRTEWEGFVTATQAAAAGGITTLIDMPLNCSPVTTTLAALQAKLAAVHNKLWVDTGFWAGATADNLAELPALLDAGVYGAKSFTIFSGIDEFQHVAEAELIAAMREVAMRGLPHLVHAELEPAQSQPMAESSSYQSFLATRPKSWENEAIALVIRAMRALHAEGLQPHAHIVHLSSAEAVPMIQQARAEGLRLTVETCPHYLVLAAETIPDGNASYKCCPPIREQSNQEQLWAALQAGIIDCVVSDHSPCPPPMKNLDSGDLENAWGGISSLQFGLPLLWTRAAEYQISLPQVAGWMSEQSAAVANITRKGTLTPGKQADFCIWDPEARFTVTPESILYRHKISPYLGRTLQGLVMETVLAGDTIFRNGQVVGEHARGKVLVKESNR